MCVCVCVSFNTNSNISRRKVCFASGNVVVCGLIIVGFWSIKAGAEKRTVCVEVLLRVGLMPRPLSDRVVEKQVRYRSEGC